MQNSLREKIASTFGHLVVDKREALQAGFELMPRFVTEYLLASARSKNAAMTVPEIRDRLRRYWVDADRKNEFISRLMRDRTAQIIALLEVEPRPDRNDHIGRIAQLDGYDLAISAALVERCPEVLYGGLWGTCALEYDLTPVKPRIVVTDFTPYQLTRPDMDQFRKGRAEFSFGEWLDLLLTSAGYRPEAFESTRHKLLALTRLIPLCQGNLNLVELGPRGTGKSYLLRNISSRAYLLAGARATPAKLLYDLQRKQVGIVGTKKVVVFDEIASTTFPDRSLVASLKDFMESGQIARGGRSLVSDCSLYLCGNLELDAEGRMPHRSYGHLLELLPDALRDAAIGDRLHGLLPGWEMPKISDDVLADGMGFVSDYFGEVLTELRREHFAMEYLRSRVALDASTTRDKTAVEKIAAGLLKLIYPHAEIEEQGLNAVLQVATELRQRVHNQLMKMSPGEFKAKQISFPGMPPHTAADLVVNRPLEDQDIEVNERDLVGKITILLVSSTGGGDRGFVECAQVGGSGDFKISGLRGAVLEQSVRASYDALLHLAPRLGNKAGDVRTGRMSVHLVNMAQPKDGPSAGLAFALAMLSAATRRPIRRGLAVTGELSVQGNVNVVGGIPEKLTAAHAHGRTHVIFPAANAAEVLKVQDVANRLALHPVRTLEEAVQIAFDISAEQAKRAIAETVSFTAPSAVHPDMEKLVQRLRDLSECLPIEEISALSDRVEDHLTRIKEAHDTGQRLDLELAQTLAGNCRGLLGRYPALEPSKQSLVVGAIRYFVSAHDLEDDLSSHSGLLDDARVIEFVMRETSLS